MQADNQPKHRLRYFLTKHRNWILAGSTAMCAAILTTTLQSPENRQMAALAIEQPGLSALPLEPANMRWGYAMDRFQLFEDELHSGDVLGSLLMQQGMNYPEVAQLVEQARATGFQVNSMRVGKKLNFLTPQGASKAAFMVYEPSPYEYVVFHLQAPYEVNIHKRAVETTVVSASGVLETNFWQALTDNGLNDELADGMIDVLATSVDFYHQKQGDRFKVVYEQHRVEGQVVGTGKILAAVYEREGKESYAFNFELPGQSCKYFDYEGRPARKAFLKAPLKVSRISSRFNLNRLHPILGFHKAHFGTDYAAPYGTPIMAVADGTVVEATRRGGNGNFVKLRHDKTYETQYLHMQGFAKGIRPGARVVQGQTIGYVGSTGLATGPHVCFRFWKNGRQVDHLRLNLPSPEPIKGNDLAQFVQAREVLKQQLNGVQYRTREEIIAEKAKNLKSKP